MGFMGKVSHVVANVFRCKQNIDNNETLEPKKASVCVLVYVYVVKTGLVLIVFGPGVLSPVC